MKAPPSAERSRWKTTTRPREPLEFESLYHSVYCGRQRLGHYVRISTKWYAAFDACGRLLGKFASQRAAFAAVGRKGNSARGGVQ
jgi:hypothetical protein